MRYLVFIVLCGFSLANFASVPDTITLDYLQKQAKLSYPLLKQKETLISANLLKIKNIKANYLPSIDLNGQATYQSDVTQVQLPQPTIDFGPSMPPSFQAPKIIMPSVNAPDKDQYKASIDVSQSIYDGGLTKKLIASEKINIGIDTLKLEVDVYQIRERINQMFFGILVAQERLSLINLFISDLNIKLKTIESSTLNGITTRTDVLLIQAEIIKAEQQVSELEYLKQASVKVLSLYIDQPINPQAKFYLADIPMATKQIIRPEIEMFSIQKTKIDAGIDLLKVKKMPKLFGFGQVGYGKPGLNMFNSEFDDYYIVGAKLSWNLCDGNKNKREKQILLLQKDLVQNQQETFEKNINIALENELGSVQRLTEALIKDQQLINIRKEISEFSYIQVQNGVKTMTEYLNDTNAEINAKTNLSLHQIQLLQAKVNYNNLLGR